MAREKKVYWLPLPKIKAPPIGPKSGKIQLNPISAITQNESINNIRMVVMSASLLVVFAIVMIGNQWSFYHQQNTAVSAMVNIKFAVHGVVSRVNYPDNKFDLTYLDSIESRVRQSGVQVWSVTLPPGESFSKQNNDLNICYTVPDLHRPTIGIAPADCGTIITVGHEVVVQYIIFRPENASLIARMIFAQR